MSKFYLITLVVGVSFLAQVAFCAELPIQSISSPSSSIVGHGSHGGACQEPSSELFELAQEDRELRDYVTNHIKSDFAQIDGIEEGNRFFDRLRLLFRRNMINTAYARAEIRELHDFLGQESTIALVRFDNRPFVEQINDERLDKLQAYTNESDLARKIYGKSIKKMIDARNAEIALKKSRVDGAGVAREPPSFWANVWCKISNNCN